MTVAQAVQSRLLSLTAVTALVGQRIRVLKFRQGDTQAIRVQRIDDIERMHLRGAIGLITSRVQVDSIALEASQADPYATVTAIDAALHGDGAGSGLSGYTGDIGSPAFHIASILPVSVQELYDLDTKLVRIMREYRVVHRA